MRLEVVETKKQKNLFINFRRNLYRNDDYYVSTTEFTFEMIFNQTTDFAKKCVIRPIMVIDNSKVLAEAIMIKNPNDNFVQVSFFEALEGVEEAVELIKVYSRLFAKENNVNRIIVGLYGHLSYGVGLTVDINRPNTFDSIYTKRYYINYFKEYKKHELCAFSSKLDRLYPYMINRKTEIIIRPIKLNDFENEMKLFGDICNKTIGNTFLFSKTDENHFYQLISDMKTFLKKENILFAFHKGVLVGFIFWHPDYNEILSKGKHESILSIAIKYMLNQNKIKRVKLNAIGVLEKYEGLVTMHLLKEASKYMSNFEIIETNFVWKNNVKSMRINSHLLKNIERTFVVFEENLCE